MTKQEAFEIAIIDGINIYIRTVLEPKGYIAPEKIGSLGCEELLRLKYQIAGDLASRWAEEVIEEQTGSANNQIRRLVGFA
jgi:hypothetical protein